ncbi:MAG: mannose-1-phosphate guanylyltransferase/mannose-6-phosphate isomerase [Xanthobacteraceae bacterium]|nr:mannose-1-phosphate guanylyltransferase/mannose-6-phosphate isomerase [Xanthobacteraceae bacterium]
MNYVQPASAIPIASPLEQSPVIERRDGEVVPVVLCGGAGARLWPTSRASRPKQFMSLIGDCSTFQAAVRRVTGPALFSRPLVLASHEHRFVVAEQLTDLSLAADIVLEPERRDSAAAIAAAAVHVAGRDPGAIVLTLAADHVIGDEASFCACVEAAAAVARKGYIMALGVIPTEPAAGFGYIRPGQAIDRTHAFAIDRFIEKPNTKLAQDYIESGYLWNSGNFVFRADVMLEELERFAPQILAGARAAVERAQHDLDFVRLDAKAFKTAPAISIDYAVMERTKRAAVLPVRYPWSDIGSWDTLWDASPRDENGNVLRGNVEIAATRNSLVRSEHMLTAVVGMNDVVVVTEPDAVLVTTRSRSAEVKDLLASMRKKGCSEADAHMRIDRPWGWYQRIDLGSRFQVKRIYVKPGGRLSLQKHFHRAEHWVVVHGTAEVQVDEKVAIVCENEAVYLPVGAVHRLANPGKIPLELIEVQVGSYTGEDDIVRMDDAYGRC